MIETRFAEKQIAIAQGLTPWMGTPLSTFRRHKQELSSESPPVF